MKDQDGQFELGSKEQQDAALMVEQVLTEYPTIITNPDKEAIDWTAQQVLDALVDIQVRDYALGVFSPDNLGIIKAALTWLVDKADENTVSAPATLLAIAYYETGDMDTASVMLDKAGHNYSMATLIKRVMAFGWAPNTFQIMRKQVGPKVKAGIFGEQA